MIADLTVEIPLESQKPGESLALRLSSGLVEQALISTIYNFRSKEALIERLLMYRDHDAIMSLIH